MSTEQWLRKCNLFVSNRKGEAIDLSQLHIKFSIKRSDTQTPNIADIRVFNLDEATSAKIKREFTRVTLQAGYEANFGVIFQGNVKQIYDGRENQTDTFMDIIAGDGDLGYNFGIVNTTIARGVTQEQQVNAAANALSFSGVTKGHIGDMPNTQLPRGKVMFGMSRDYLRNIASTTDKTWSIQDEKITFVPLKSYLPGTAVEVNSKTGMIGTPVQTNEGVNTKVLLNPRIRIGTRVKLNNKDIQRLKINLSTPLSPANIPAPLTADGVYYVLVIEHDGDNRGNEWYTNLTCLNINVTTNPLNAVSVGT